MEPKELGHRYLGFVTPLDVMVKISGPTDRLSSEVHTYVSVESSNIFTMIMVLICCSMVMDNIEYSNVRSSKLDYKRDNNYLFALMFCHFGINEKDSQIAIQNREFVNNIAV